MWGAESLMEQVAFNTLHVSGEKVGCATIVAQGVIDQADIVVGFDLKSEITVVSSDGEGMLTRLDSAAVVGYPPIMVTHTDRDASQSTVILERLGGGLSL